MFWSQQQQPLPKADSRVTSTPAAHSGGRQWPARLQSVDARPPAAAAQRQAREPLGRGVPGRVARARVPRRSRARRVAALARLPTPAAHLQPEQCRCVPHTDHTTWETAWGPKGRSCSEQLRSCSGAARQAGLHSRSAASARAGAGTCQSAERDSSALGPARAADGAGARGGASPERAHGFSGALWRTPLCRLSARRTLRDSSTPEF